MDKGGWKKKDWWIVENILCYLQLRRLENLIELDWDWLMDHDAKMKIHKGVAGWMWRGKSEMDLSSCDNKKNDEIKRNVWEKSQ